MNRSKLTWFSLRFPLDLDEHAVIAALSSFSGLPHGARLLFDLTATSSSITHRLAVTSSAADTMTGSLRAAIPSLRLNHIEAPNYRYNRRLLWQLSPFAAAIRSDESAATSASLLSSLFPLGSNESIRLIWTMRSAIRPRVNVTREGRSEGQVSTLKRKLALPGLNAYGELSIGAKDPSRAVQLLRRTGSILNSLSTPYGHLIADPYWYGQAMRFIYQRGRFFSVAELAAVIGWPIDSPDLPGLELGASKRLVPSLALPSRGRVLGKSDVVGLDRPVAITPAASTRGLYILGPTGTGKTSLIKNLVRDDLSQGRGLAVVETNGDLVNDLIDLIPPNRVKDVVLLDPLDRTPMPRRLQSVR